MIYWFTGQPCAGKTVLANMLKKEKPGAFRIDGDDMRELFSNKDYSINGRVINVGTAQRIAQYLSNQGKDVIVSLVAPYIDQREDFKAIAYTPPLANFVDIDTTHDTEEQSFEKVLDAING